MFSIFPDSKFNRLVDKILEREPLTWTYSSTYHRMPMISKDENGYEIKFTLPGYEKEDLQIFIEDECLTIKTVDSIEELHFFEKSYELPEDTDFDSCNASMKAGILTIKFNFNKPVEVPKKQIKIN